MRLKTKFLLLTLPFITLASDFTTERVSSYVRGVSDTINFLEAELNIQPPKQKFWLWIDVSPLPFWQRVALANILKEREGKYPLYLYNSVTYQAVFVLKSENSLNSVVNTAKTFKTLYPQLKFFVTEINDPAIFKPVVRLAICKLPKPRNSYEGVLQAIESAKLIASSLADKTLENYLERVEDKIKQYIKIKQEDLLEEE
jgi:hypothetical protein